MCKWFWAICLCTILASTSAMAATSVDFCIETQSGDVGSITYADRYVQCVLDGRIYVKHYVQNSSGMYTNLFHAVDESGNLIGSKWCTPSLKLPLQSTSIRRDTEYTVAVHTSTKYFELRQHRRKEKQAYT